MTFDVPAPDHKRARRALVAALPLRATSEHLEAASTHLVGKGFGVRERAGGSRIPGTKRGPGTGGPDDLRAAGGGFAAWPLHTARSLAIRDFALATAPSAPRHPDVSAVARISEQPIDQPIDRGLSSVQG